MANNHLNESVRQAIIEEVMKGYNFKSPDEFESEVRALADKHMTDEEKLMVSQHAEISKHFPMEIHPFYMSNISRYLMNRSIKIPSRMRSSDSDFMKEVKEIGDCANEVLNDKTKLVNLIHSNKTISQFKKNLPQFVEQLNKVLSSGSPSAPATVADMSFLDKYKKVQNESGE